MDCCLQCHILLLVLIHLKYLLKLLFQKDLYILLTTAITAFDPACFSKY